MTTVLLHGLGADRTQPLALFAPVLEKVAPVEPVIALDTRAHGGSPLIGQPADFALDSLARELAASVTALMKAEPSAGATAAASPAGVTLIGISMGAALALRIALDGLLPVRRAIFVRPAFTNESLPENLWPFPVIAELLTRLGPDAGTAVFRESSLYHHVAAVSPLGGRGLLAQFTAPDAAARAVRLTEIPRNRTYGDAASLAELSERGIPSLVVAAARDPVHPVSVAEEWAAGLGAALTHVPARDDSQAAHTAAVRSAVAGWLSQTT